MSRLPSIGAVLLLACQPGSDPVAVSDAGTEPDAAQPVVGYERYEACGGSTPCAPGTECINPVSRAAGTCTVTCLTDDDCGGDVCAPTDPAVCAPACEDNPASCAPGTTCGDVEGRLVCLGARVRPYQCFSGGAKLDLLFMVDNSNSMAQEQANLTANFERLLSALVHPPDRNHDGLPDWEALEDVHVGVVSSDAGTGGYEVQTCANSAVGDDGQLLHAGNVRLDGCAPDYPVFLEGPSDDLAAAFDCIATLGTGGCGFEQQLESTRRALMDRMVDTNAGFLRADTAVAIVLVTDEDDCSASDPTIFNPQNSALGVMTLRCAQHPEMITPVSSFVDAFLSLRDNTERLTVAAITGVPPSLLAPYGNVFTPQAFDEILAAPEMQFQVEAGRLIPSCDVAGLGEAVPPRRIVELLRDVSAQAPGSAYLGSICASDWTDTVEGLAASIGRSLCAPIE